MNTKAAFKEGETLFCLHMGKYYECKCLNTRFNESTTLWEYLIHYQGWSKKWDEWAPEERLLKSVPANIRKKEQENDLMKKNKKQNRKLKGNTPAKIEPVKEEEKDEDSTQPQTERPRSRARKTKRASPVTVQPTNPPESGDTPPVKQPKLQSKPATPVANDKPPTITTTVTKTRHILKPANLIGKFESILSNPDNLKVNIPPKLQNWLTEDCAQLNDTNQPKIIKLPADTSVTSIVNKYETFMLNNAPLEEHAEIKKNANYYLQLFATSLPSRLLTKWERQQYIDLRSAHPDRPDISVCDIYGSHHLLRMFDVFSVLLESLPSNSNLDQLPNMFENFLNFLVTNEKEFFKMENFVPAPAEYRRAASAL